MTDTQTEAPPPIPGGLIWALRLDGARGAVPLDWAAVRAWQPVEGVLWVHLDRTASEAQEWLRTEAQLDPLVVDALLAEDPRPRAEAFGDARMIVLRGVNLNPGKDPEDMVAVRVWIDGARIITSRRQPVLAIADIRDRLQVQAGPRSSGGFLAQLSDNLIRRMGPVIDELQEELDDLEERITGTESVALFREIANARRTAITLRRYLAPQREATSLLVHEHTTWLNEGHRAGLREAANRLLRYVEDLDAVRDRAAVAQEEFHTHMSERLNRNMYLLTIVAAIFLPLGLLTGLLGINVGGIPGADYPAAFFIVCALLGGVATLQLLLFHRLKLF